MARDRDVVSLGLGIVGAAVAGAAAGYMLGRSESQLAKSISEASRTASEVGDKIALSFDKGIEKITLSFDKGVDKVAASFDRGVASFDRSIVSFDRAIDTVGSWKIPKNGCKFSLCPLVMIPNEDP